MWLIIKFNNDNEFEVIMIISNHIMIISNHYDNLRIEKTWSSTLTGLKLKSFEPNSCPWELTVVVDSTAESVLVVVVGTCTRSISITY